MKTFIRENGVLVVAFSLPILLLVVVALSAYLPSAFLSTNYNFVYAACIDDANRWSYRCDPYLQQKYSVVDGQVVANEIDPTQDSDGDDIPDVQEGYDARLFLYDTLANETREITIEEAAGLQLNELVTSPDGVSVANQYDRGADFFLFYNGGSNYGHYLVKGNAKSKLNVITDNDRYYYGDNFEFLGWVLPGRE